MSEALHGVIGHMRQTGSYGKIMLEVDFDAGLIKTYDLTNSIRRRFTVPKPSKN
jgi:hypothetical protein